MPMFARRQSDLGRRFISSEAVKAYVDGSAYRFADQPDFIRYR